MSTRGVADVVLCIDDSGSMAASFAAVTRHLSDFVDGLRSAGQQVWDLRLDYVVYSTKDGPYRSMYNPDLWRTLYGGQQGRYFTTDVEEFQRALGGETSRGTDESSLIGLDFALDFPWRASNGCHRVVIQLTDEPHATGETLGSDPQAAAEQLLQKVQELGVMLFLVAPSCDVYSTLAEADRAEYLETDVHSGIGSVDFERVMSFIGKSVSTSMLQKSATSNPGPLFGQPSWRRS